MGLVARVRRTLERRQLFSRGTFLVVACSGGPDSTALLHALHALVPPLGLKLAVASVDHGLRPEAAQEVELVSRHAARLGLSMHRLRVEVDFRRCGKQAGARRARYAALASLRDDLGADAVATGHTLDDQAETVVARLLRSPSVGALGGIQPRRGDAVVRPLIDCRREHVEAFVARHRLEVVRDPSNRDDRYTRVRVREALLPMLQRENPRIVEALAALADDARGHRALVDQVAPGLDLGAPGAREALRRQPEAVRRQLVRGWLAAHAGRAPRLEHVVQLADLSRPGEVRVPGPATARWEPDGSLRMRPTSKRGRGA